MKMAAEMEMQSRSRIDVPRMQAALPIGADSAAGSQEGDSPLAKIFSDLRSGAEGSDTLSYIEFRSALADGLKLELAEAELLRIWGMLADKKEEDNVRVSEAHRREIRMETFAAKVCEEKFMLEIAKLLDASNFGFAIDAAYDWQRPTCENYAVRTAAEQTFVGKYAELRRQVDYRYHARYDERRHAWQDHAIDLVVEGRPRQASPWVVYTCGPMGVGKGHALRWMSDSGYFPLDGIVCIDPDHFKRMMPEWTGYVERSEGAGGFCHSESGFLQEIAQEVAMRSSQNVWVDGSLRDGAWYSSVLKDLRRRYPHYQLAIFEVSASEPTIRQRIAERAIRTGRSVPEHLIRASLQSVAVSLEKLTPLVDFVARIGNDGPTPCLRAYIRVDASGDWGLVRSQFIRQGRSSFFPQSLTPLLLTPLASPEAVLRPVAAGTASLNGASPPLGRLALNLSHPGLKPMRMVAMEAGPTSKGPGAASDTSESESLELLLSPERPVTYDHARRVALGIPLDAVTFAFVHPAPVQPATLPKGVDLGATAECALAIAGGFCYFDSRHVLCGVNAINHLLPYADGGAEAGARIEFAAPVRLRPDALSSLARERLRPVTLANQLSKGARQFAFVVAGEGLPTPDGGSKVFLRGGFAFVVDEAEQAGGAGLAGGGAAGGSSCVLCFPVAD